MAVAELEYGTWRKEERQRDPYECVVDSLDTCVDDNGYIHASGLDEYANGDWARDLLEIGKGLLAINHKRGIKVLGKVLDRYLSSSPRIPFRHMQYNHTLFRFGVSVPSNQNEHEVAWIKQVFNKQALKGESPIVTDTFVMLELLSHYCLSENVGESERRDMWQRHQGDIALFMAEFTKPSQGFVSHDGLIVQSPLTSRADCIYKSGKELYTNVKWYMTLEKLREATEIMGNIQWSQRFGSMAECVKKSINSTFWDEKNGFFIDWVDKSGVRHDHMETLGNGLAIISGVANDSHSARIARYMRDEVYDARAGLMGTVDKEYNADECEWILRKMEGTAWFNSKEHGVFWPEMTIVSALAFMKVGMEYEAKILMRSIDDLIRDHKTLHETYGVDRQPITYSKKLLGILPIRYESTSHFGMALGWCIFAFYNKGNGVC